VVTQRSVVKSTSRRSSERAPGEETLRLLDLKNKQEAFIKWLVEEERVVLERMARASQLGESVHPDQLKIWRSEIRVPAMYRDLKLNEKQLEQV